MFPKWTQKFIALGLSVLGSRIVFCESFNGKSVLPIDSDNMYIWHTDILYYGASWTKFQDISDIMFIMVYVVWVVHNVVRNVLKYGPGCP